MCNDSHRSCTSHFRLEMCSQKIKCCLPVSQVMTYGICIQYILMGKFLYFLPLDPYWKCWCDSNKVQRAGCAPPPPPVMSTRCGACAAWWGGCHLVPLHVLPSPFCAWYWHAFALISCKCLIPSAYVSTQAPKLGRNSWDFILLT